MIEKNNNIYICNISTIQKRAHEQDKSLMLLPEI